MADVPTPRLVLLDFIECIDLEDLIGVSNGVPPKLGPAPKPSGTLVVQSVEDGPKGVTVTLGDEDNG